MAELGQTNKFSLSDAIIEFNQIYKLPVNHKPTLNIGVDVVQRLKSLRAILHEEVDEIEEIIVAYQDPDAEILTPAILTMIADLLGDIQVYCASEMRKFGLPNDLILQIIMESNFSKLGADGNPIYDERGKVMKGTNYWKPEPKIEELINQLME